MKSAAAKPSAKPPSVAAQDGASDPLLQGTYVSQDDIGTAQDLDDFEARLAQGVPAHHRRPVQVPQVPARKAAAPKPSQPVPTSQKKVIQPNGTVALTEEEEEKRQDISDVRNLGDGDSSDDE